VTKPLAINRPKMAVQAAISGPRFGWQAVPKKEFAAAVAARKADMGVGDGGR
jgi:molybdate-binding protein